MGFKVLQRTRFTYEYLGGGFVGEHMCVVAWRAKHPFNRIVKGDEYNPVQATALGDLGLIAGT